MKASQLASLNPTTDGNDLGNGIADAGKAEKTDLRGQGGQTQVLSIAADHRIMGWARARIMGPLASTSFTNAAGKVHAISDVR